jgi:predicted Holliday junction resolvase-like endonuclease
MILAAILGVLAFGLLLGLLRAKKQAAAKAQELEAFQQSLESFRAAAQKQAMDSLESQLSVFRTEFGQVARRQALEQAQLEFDKWKVKYTKTEREDAIKQSKAVNRGLVAEQLAPHMVGFPYSPKDCHFIGQPVDYVIFSGLDAGKLDRIVLLEVKTGESQMNARERQVRDVVQAGSVTYEIYRLEEDNAKEI